MYLEPPDPELAARVAALGRGWGGSFEVVGVEDWKRVIRTSGSLVVHLTMYGQPLERVLPRLRRAPRILLVVGGAKVPADLYRFAGVNVAVGHQPHSEVAAVAIVLERLLGIPGPRPFPGATRHVVPRARGKKVVTRRRSE
jgi:tRNA (cytidine56-2'-O)-methyltransferase